MVRSWPDIIHGYRRCSFRTIRSLERRGIVEIVDLPGPRGVRLTSEGLRLRALICPAQSTTLERAF
jgi:hypothetical protein